MSEEEKGCTLCKREVLGAKVANKSQTFHVSCWLHNKSNGLSGLPAGTEFYPEQPPDFSPLEIILFTVLIALLGVLLGALLF